MNEFSVATNRLHSEPNLIERLYEEEKRRNILGRRLYR
jgi:hypothetical protein